MIKNVQSGSSDDISPRNGMMRFPGEERKGSEFRYFKISSSFVGLVFDITLIDSDKAIVSIICIGYPWCL